MSANTIKEMPKDSRPYEKFLAHGADILTNAELLAIILRTGTQGCGSVDVAQAVLDLPGADPGLLKILHASREELMSIPGVGLVKAIQLKCIGELSRRIYKETYLSGLSFKQPGTVADAFREDFRHKEQEELVVFYLNSKCCLITQETISKGTVNEAIVPSREILINATRYRAVYMVLMHNHPSGDPHPSTADILTTQRMKSAVREMGVELLDHIIIGDREYFSFQEENMMNF